MAFPYAAAGAGLLSFFGGGGDEMELDPQTRFFLQKLRDLYQRNQRYGRSAPLSDPREQMALAQDRGMAAEFMKSKRDQLYAAAGPELASSMPDMMTNLGLAETAQMMGIDSTHLLAALDRRHQAKFGTAADIASRGAAASPRQMTGGGSPDMSQLLANLAYTSAYSSNRSPRSSTPASTDKNALDTGGARTMPAAGAVSSPNNAALLGAISGPRDMEPPPYRRKMTDPASGYMDLWG